MVVRYFEVLPMRISEVVLEERVSVGRTGVKAGPRALRDPARVTGPTGVAGPEDL